MSLTLLRVVKGKLPIKPFTVDIDRSKTIYDLQEAIKSKMAPVFNCFDANQLKLWAVKINMDSEEFYTS